MRVREGFNGFSTSSDSESEMNKVRMDDRPDLISNELTD
jgi:hypothetical protein